jgi:SAM-dependent methyltransferase
VADDWADTKGRFWAERADHVSRMLAGPGDHLARGAALQPGERVLDVGCGCGDSTLAAAEAVGPDGQVLGVDLSPAQLDVARERAEERGLANVDVRVADAGVDDVGEGYDAVISRLGVMFFADPAAAFTKLHDALGPGGRIAFVCWQHPDENPWIQVSARAFAEVLDVEPAPPDELGGAMSLRDPERVRRVLDGAGFRDVDLEGVICDIHLGETADQAVEFARTMEYARTALEAAPPDVADEAVERARAALAAEQGPDGIRLPGRLWLVRARA